MTKKNKKDLLKFIRFSSVLVVLFACRVSVAQICSTDANVAIPDGSGSSGAGTPASISIVVPAIYTNAITDLTFDLRINHTYVGDLIATLTSPAGTTVTLMDRPGVPASTFGCFRNNVEATFDDASGTAVESQCATPGAAIQSILNPQGSLSSFDGETPAGTWTLTVTDNAGQDTGTIISASNCLDLTTVPVVMSSFSSRQRGRGLVTQWQTASEAFNLGFHLWGNVEGEWTQLNKRMIPSKAIDSVEPMSYRRRVNINTLPSPPTQIGISSVSSSGFEEFYGPFQIGEEYGEITVPKAIDWSAQREKHAGAMRERGYEMLNGKWRRITKRSRFLAAWFENRYEDLWLNIDEAGLYRLTHEELMNQGINLSGLPINRLALSHAGQPIARRVTGSDRRPRKFGTGAEIVFFAQPPTGDQARYANSLNVRLSADRELALNAPKLDASDTALDSASNTHIKTVNFGQPSGYSFIVPGDSPWYDEVIYAFGNTGVKSMTFTVDQQAQLDMPASIELNLMGGTSFDNIDVDGDGEVEPDHHYRVYLNRQLFPKPVYEGYSEMVDAVKIQAKADNQLILGENTLELEVIPDNGHNIDAAYFLNGSVKYLQTNRLSEDINVFALGEAQQSIKIADELRLTKRVFAVDSTGNFSELSPLFERGFVGARAPAAIGNSVNRTLWFTGANGFLSVPEVTKAASIDDSALSVQDIDFVIIADESLMGAQLNRFVALQQDLGRATKVISAQDIYAHYSDGIELPSAIARFLREAAVGTSSNEPSPYEYVLLVGGHTYNYLGFNVSDEERPINMIPSFYRNGKQTINRQIPTAVPFVDFNGDGAPERAIGRWPVRDTEQLKKVVDKTIAWHQNGSNKNNQRALLIAQKDEPLNQFTAGLERINEAIGSESNPWQPSNKLLVSEILADNEIPADQKISYARDQLVDGFNQGPALAVYNGHASPTTWGRENLLTTSVVDRFTNHQSPTLVLPLACYTTYYETPSVKSLSERLFSDNAAGAVGLSGPALLSYSSENERFAKQVLTLMTRQGLSLGTAVLHAKRAIHGTGDRRQTVIYNWVTLSDPTLDFGLPVEIPAIEEPDEPKTIH